MRSGGEAPVEPEPCLSLPPARRSQSECIVFSRDFLGVPWTPPYESNPLTSNRAPCLAFCPLPRQSEASARSSHVCRPTQKSIPLSRNNRKYPEFRRLRESPSPLSRGPQLDRRPLLPRLRFPSGPLPYGLFGCGSRWPSPLSSSFWRSPGERGFHPPNPPDRRRVFQSLR
jgi:hypothetical protein